MMPKVKLQTQKEILPIPAFLEHGRIRRDTQFMNVEKQMGGYAEIYIEQSISSNNLTISSPTFALI